MGKISAVYLFQINFYRDYLGEDYIFLKSENLSAIHMMIFAHKTLCYHISCIIK